MANNKLIQWKYVPRRVMRLLKANELGRLEVWAAGQFCYFEEHNWLLWSSGTNFPKGFKVQTSIGKIQEPRVDAVQPKPDPLVYEILKVGLLEVAPFKEVALVAGVKGEKSKMHREGKIALRKSLIKFAHFLGH